ncbi:MAG: aspartyl/asparaginyl beta-hydroxylase domain-containing protein [Saprospiraceae bacterium]|nr:aspartyl/asparaginyl beta-hydroxylase domain-containing protein [Saprospiraceae bacterium]
MAIDFLKLPFEFDEQLLLRDLDICQEYVWKDHFNTSDYVGEWKIIALRSTTGESVEITASPAQDYKDTELLSACSYFKKAIDTLECEKESVRLMSLAAGSLIKEHTDNMLTYLEGNFRIHIPIRTEPEVTFFFNKVPVNMKVGEMWYGDFSMPHSIEHLGKFPRVHLVIDCLRNDWSDQLFKNAGFDFEYYKRLANEKRMRDLPFIISNLEHMGDPKNFALIAELKAELEICQK